MAISAIGFLLGRLVAQQQGVQDPNDVNKAALVGSVVGTSPVGLALTVAIAQREAQDEPAPTVTPAPIAIGAGQVEVPSVQGLTQADAQVQLQNLGLQAAVVPVTSDSTVKGIVISSDPAAQTPVAAGTSVRLFVSNGFAVPDVTNLAVFNAQAQLTKLGLNVNAGSAQLQDIVQSQDPPAGTLVSKGDTVTLTTSSAQPPTSNLVEVPSVQGLTQADAQVQLQNLGLQAAVVPVTSDSTVKGIVISSDPAAQTPVAAGTSVRLFVSNGFAVPDVTNRTYADAKSQLESRGLSVDPPSASDDQTVTSQDPPAGTQVSKGDTVTLTLTPATVSVPTVIKLDYLRAQKKLTDLGLKVDPTSASDNQTVTSQDPPAGTQVSKGDTVTLTLTPVAK